MPEYGALCVRERTTLAAIATCTLLIGLVWSSKA